MSLAVVLLDFQHAGVKMTDLLRATAVTREWNVRTPI